MDLKLVSADEIRAQLHATRNQMREEAHAVAEGAHELTDWRYYARRFPWATVGAVTLLGYAAVPRRLEIMSPDVKTLAKLARQNKLVIDPKPSGARRPGLMDTALTMTGNILLRAGLAYMGQKMGKVLAQQAAETPQENWVS